MKRFIKYLVVLFFAFNCFSSANAQNNEAQSDDMKRIAIAPTLPAELNIYPSASLNILLGKMKSMVGLNGLSAVEGGSLFVIYPQISVLKSDVTATAPPMLSYRLEVVFNIADFYTGNVYATTSLEIVGVGKTQTVAYNAAFQMINPRNGKFKVMIDKAKDEILGYYNSHCDLVISHANSLATQRKYSEALDLLNSVPPVCRECFDKSNLAASEIAKNMPVIIPQPSVVDDNPKNEPVVETGDLVELGHNIFIRYKSARLIGDITHVYFELISRNEDDYDQEFPRIYDTFIINEKGEELRISKLIVGLKENNYYLKATLIPEVNTELVCEFPKVKEIKMLRFLINDNYFRFKNIIITK
ncbi:MAG: hypothetical protein PHS84_06325 [Paludibacter sp.]|jgi:hypothetical protein|nr:hypothetical protein [Paludibacter sp.]